MLVARVTNEADIPAARHWRVTILEPPPVGWHRLDLTTHAFLVHNRQLAVVIPELDELDLEFWDHMTDDLSRQRGR